LNFSKINKFEIVVGPERALYLLNPNKINPKRFKMSKGQIKNN
jgi:hypothetical protein